MQDDLTRLDALTISDSEGQRSKASKGLKTMVFQVIENMERETGIEATNSLEGCQSIENKQLLRP